MIAVLGGLASGFSSDKGRRGDAVIMIELLYIAVLVIGILTDQTFLQGIGLRFGLAIPSDAGIGALVVLLEGQGATLARTRGSATPNRAPPSPGSS